MPKQRATPADSAISHHLIAQIESLPGSVRQNRIADLVLHRGFVSVPSVATEFRVSEMTIRRDLSELERKGRVVRTHGGAMAPEEHASPVVDRIEPAFDARLHNNRQAKERIAAAAVELMGSSRTVALDVGTTTYLLATRLLQTPHLLAFTNSLRIAMLATPSGTEMHIPGGQIRRNEMSVYGPSAVSLFEKLWFDIAFIGVSGTTADGIYDYSAEDSEMKRVYLRRSSRKVVLCDSLKFRRMSLVKVAPLDEIDVLVTDAQPPRDVSKALEDAGVELRIAPELPPTPR